MKKMIGILFLFPLLMFGQNIDSLKMALKNAKHDTLRCAILTVMIEAEVDDHIWPKYNEELEKIAKENIAKSTALKNVYMKHYAYALNNIGYLANSQGDIPKAIEYFRKSLFMQEKINDKMGMAESFNNIGAIYKAQGLIKKAQEHYQQCLRINSEIGNNEGIGTACNNIAGIYEFRGDKVKALEYYNRALKITEEQGDKIGIALSLNNIGYIYNEMGEISKSLSHFKRSLKITDEIGDKRGTITSLCNVAVVLAESGNANQGVIYAKRAMKESMEIGFPESIKNSAQALKKVFQNQNKFKEATEMYELEIKMRDSMDNDVTRKAAIKNQIQYVYEKKEAVEKAKHRAELITQQAVADERERKQDIIIWSVVAGLVLLIGFAAYVFKTLSVTKKQKLMIEIKSREVEEKQGEILDSIHYARRIQTALMPSAKYIGKNLVRLQKL